MRRHNTGHPSYWRAFGCLTVFFALSISSSPQADADTAPPLDGMGAMICSQYVAYEQTDPQASRLLLFQWVAGFVSADNVFIGDYHQMPFDPSLPGNVEAKQISWVDEYCLQNPNDPLDEAAIYMLSAARKNGGTLP
jgi:hypothetical protein